jgi:hypothetical protein
MRTMIDEYAGAGVFQPEEVATLVLAFDNCWERLHKSGVRYASDRAMQAARAQLGRGIIEAARRGERDPHRLCEDAMLQIARADRREAP